MLFHSIQFDVVGECISDDYVLTANKIGNFMMQQLLNISGKTKMEFK
jgi:hypothetical protein